MAETEYIALSQVMRGVLPFIIIIKEISFLLELEDDVPKVKPSLFFKPVVVHEFNQGKILLTIAP